MFHVGHKMFHVGPLFEVKMGIIRYSSQNYFQASNPIEAVCLHGTAGSLWGSLATLRDVRVDNPALAVSSNYLIDKNGQIYELVPWQLNRRAYANGVVENYDKSLNWLVQAVRAGLNPNLITVSIEHVAGELEMISRASMPNAQFNSSIELTANILAAAGLKANHQTIVGHNQISGYKRYNCPGVIFPPAYTEVLINRFPELG